MKSSCYRLFAVVLAAASLFPGAKVGADEAQAQAQPNPAPPAEQAPEARLYADAAGNLLRVHLNTVLMRADSSIGVEAAQVDDVLRSHLGLAVGKGVLVTSVTADGPAATAGIQKNDVLITVGDQDVAGPETLDKLLEGAGEKPTPIVLIRAGKKQTVTVTPNATRLQFAIKSSLPADEPRFWLGIGASAADDTLRSHLAVPAGEGLVVTSVEGESPAARSGVMVNDILLKLDGKPLTTIEALSAQLQEIGDKSVPLELLRHGKPAMLTVTPVKQAADMWLRSFVRASDFWVTSLDNSVVNFAGERLSVLAFDIQSTAAPPPTPDLAAQIAELLEQVGKLQKSLESLDAAVKAQAPAAPAGAENK